MVTSIPPPMPPIIGFPGLGKGVIPNSGDIFTLGKNPPGRFGLRSISGPFILIPVPSGLIVTVKGGFTGGLARGPGATSRGGAGKGMTGGPELGGWD